MTEPTNRRGFLRSLMRSAGDVLVDAADAAKAAQGDPDRSPTEAPLDPPPLLTPASPATRSLTAEELLDLAADEGLAHRSEALRHLARASTRMTPAPDGFPTRSSIGRPAATANTDGTVAAVAAIDLADPALAGSPLPSSGGLVALITVPRRAPIKPCSRAQIRVEAEAAPAPAGTLRVQLTTALTLPRAWAAPVQALGLDEDEQARYVRLRERVAELQGVTADDGGAEGVAHHHLLGYPTETSGTMPLACELASRGLDPDTPPADLPPGVVAASERWRLLLQLTQDRRSAVVIGAGPARLFLWIADHDLECQDFSDVWAVAR